MKNTTTGKDKKIGRSISKLTTTGPGEEFRPRFSGSTKTIDKTVDKILSMTIAGKHRFINEFLFCHKKINDLLITSNMSKLLSGDV